MCPHETLRDLKSLWAGENGLNRTWDLNKNLLQKATKTPAKAALKLSCLVLSQVSETQENLQHQEYLGVAAGHIAYQMEYSRFLKMS